MNSRACTGSICPGAGYSDISYSCSSSKVLTTTNDFYTENCSGGSCVYVLASTSSSTTPCGTDTCSADGTLKEYCKSGNIWEKKEGPEDSCTASASSGYCSSPIIVCADNEKVSCDPGYTCKMVAPDDAECVPLSTTWTET
jgi:hypothetical protein